MTNKEQDRLEAIEELRLYIKPSTRLIFNIKSVSKSGMSRRMQVFTVDKKTGLLFRHTYAVAKLLGYTYNDNDDTITVKGTGMDMRFWLADRITHELWGDKKPKSLKGNGGACLDWQTI